MKALHIHPPAESAPVRRSLARLLLRHLNGAAGRFIREMRIRRDMRHLESLSDHMLSDIGISRGQIAHVLRKGRIVPNAAREARPRESDPNHKSSGKSGETGKIIKFVHPAPAVPANSKLPMGRRLSREAG